jgi:hypothetical protein
VDERTARSPTPPHTTPSSERSDDEVNIRREFAQAGELQSVPRFISPSSRCHRRPA